MDIRKENLDRVDNIINESLVIKDGVPLPSVIELSLVDFCNRKCSFCPKSLPEVAPDNPLQMDWALVVKLNSDLLDMGFKGLITLCGFGEPMLYRHLEDAIALLSQNFKVDLITNGDVLDKEKADRLISLGLNMLLISIYDEADVAWLTEATSNVPPDKLMLRLRYDTLAATNRGGTLKMEAKPVVGPCHYLAYHMMFDWNGDVTLCPQDWNRRVKFGNLAYKSVFEIWKSTYMNSWRQGLFKGRTKLPCVNCDTDGTLHGDSHKEVWCK